MDKILDCLTRGLDLNILTRGYGIEHRGVVVSYQAQAPVLAAVLPSNSPGVHTLWLPAIPLQMGLVLKPGPQEPWTPYRMMSAFTEAGIPKEVFRYVSGRAGSGCRRARRLRPRDDLWRHCRPSNATRGTRVSRHTARASRRSCSATTASIDWEKYLDLMVESIYINSGRGCINCSGVWASRHTKEIAQAIAERIGPIEVKPPNDPRGGSRRLHGSRHG